MNIGIIGSGFIVPVFIETSKKFKDYHLRAIWGRHEEKLLGFKDDFDYYTTDLEKMLSDKRVDVVYIALPNALHYEYAMKALKHGKHVMLEKPFTVHYDETKKLIDYARKHKLIIFEAIVTKHNPNYQKMIKLKDKLGDIKMVCANFSQYSRRYDRFKKGEITPVFNSKMAGGALLDLNVYNIHFVVGMFGRPKKVNYFPNVERGVDTSGVLILDYGKFKATLMAGKDCKADNYAIVQSDEGYLRCNTTASRCGNFTLKFNNKEAEEYGADDNEFGGWVFEMKEFAKIYKKKDLDKAYEYNQTTLDVAYVLDKAIKSGGLEY